MPDSKIDRIAARRRLIVGAPPVEVTPDPPPDPIPEEETREDKPRRGRPRKGST